MDEPRSFQTLRGFITGEEPDEEPYFAYSATLRIGGDPLDLDRITQALGLTPTHVLRKGERSKPSSRPAPHDRWHYEPDVPETERLETHIDALWAAVKPHADFLRSLKDDGLVDVFLGYRSNIDHAGVVVPSESLEMFTELGIPFSLSIIVT